MKNAARYFAPASVGPVILVLFITITGAQKNTDQEGTSTEAENLDKERQPPDRAGKNRTNNEGGRALLFSVDSSKFQIDLDNGNLSDNLRDKFDKNHIRLSRHVTIKKESGNKWLITDKDNHRIYNVRRHDSNLNIYSPTYFLKVSDSAWPMILEDGEYSDELIDEIVADINLVYSRFMKHRILSGNPSRRVQIGGRVKKSESYLDFSINKGYFIPDILADNFGDLIETDGIYQIVISDLLIDQYKKALELKHDHEEAFNQLVTFIDFVNGLNASTNLSDSEVKELFYLYSEPIKNLSLESLRRNAKKLPKYRIEAPSLLGFFILDNQKNLICCETILIKRETGEAVEEITLCNLGSKWRLTF